MNGRIRKLFGLPVRGRPTRESLGGDRHAAQVMRALGKASEAMREGRTQEELFAATGSTLAEIGLSTAILLLDDTGEQMGITYLSNDSALIRQAESLVGLKREEFTARPDQTRLYRETMLHRRTIFIEDASEVMLEVLPGVPRAVLRAVSRLLGFRGVLGAPLLDEGKAIGLMVVSSLDLTSEDAQVVQLFAAQLGAILRTVRLNNDLKRSLTNLENTKTQLLEAQKRETIGLLAGGVAHDFNNLLSAISLSAEQIEGADDGHDVADDVCIIRDACERGGSLVAQLLALGRRTELKIGTFTVARLVGDLERLLQRVLGEDVHIALRLEDVDTAVEGDRSQLEQVLINLALNARDAMPGGGTLTLRTRRVKLLNPPPPLSPGDHVEIEVVDEGRGMTTTTLERAFDPFFTTKGRARGTGLGLSVVKSIVEHHAGMIHVESTPESGTTFRILLPASNQMPDERQAEVEVDTVRGDGELILIIEDDPLVRRTCSRALRHAGWRVHCVEDGAAARAAVKELGDDIRLIFCDVVLPDERGPSLLDDITVDMRSAGVLVTSGYVDERADRELIRERGWAFLAKPYRHHELLSTIHGLLASSSDGIG